MTNRNHTPWTAANIPAQTGRRVLITGANSGIGYETALELARKGAEIILPARTLEKAENAAQRIRNQIPSAQIHPATLDLASLASVRAFAAWFTQRFPGPSAKPSLDLLINNAGVMAIPTRELTVDGFERQFATNFLGPFALTALLYPHLRQEAGTRIVIVSSSVTKWAKIDFDNLQSERKYRPLDQAYSQSKLADSLFAFELHRRLAQSNSPIRVTAAHPGYAITNLQTSGPGAGISAFSIIGNLLKPIASQNAHMGALPTLYAATAPEAESGGYYGPGGFLELKGPPVPVAIPARAQNAADATRLWTVAERLTGIPFPLPAPSHRPSPSEPLPSLEPSPSLESSIDQKMQALPSSSS